MLADSLAKALGGTDLERAPNDRAAATADALMPDLIVLAGDAAQDRGAAVLAELSDVNTTAPPPVIVVFAPELGGLASQPTPRHIGYLAPEGGVVECARRVQALLDLVVDQNLQACTLQQLADTVSSRAKPSPAKQPAAVSKGRLPTQEYAATAKGMAPLPKPLLAGFEAPQPSAANDSSPASQGGPVPQPSAAKVEATAPDAPKAPAAIAGSDRKGDVGRDAESAPSAAKPAAISGARAGTAQMPAAQLTTTAAAISGEQPARTRAGTAQMPAAQLTTSAAAISGEHPARAGTAQMPAMLSAPNAAAPIGSAEGARARTATAEMPAASPSAAAAMSGKALLSRTAGALSSDTTATAPAQARARTAQLATATTPRAPLIAPAGALDDEIDDSDFEPTIVGKLDPQPSAAKPPASPRLGTGAQPSLGASAPRAASAAKSAFTRTLLNATPSEAKAAGDAPTTSPRLGIVTNVAKPAVTPKAVFTPAASSTATDAAPTTPNPIIASNLSEMLATVSLSTAPTAPNAVVTEPDDAPMNAPPPLPSRSQREAEPAFAAARALPATDPLDEQPTLPPSAAAERPSMPAIMVSLSEAPPADDASTVRPSADEINVTFSEAPPALAAKAIEASRPAKAASAQDTVIERVRPTSPLQPSAAQRKPNASAERVRRPTNPLEPAIVAAQAPQRPTNPLEPAIAAVQAQRRPTNPLEPAMTAPQAQPLAAISGSTLQRRGADAFAAPAAWPDSSSAAVHDLPVTAKPRGSRWRMLAIAGAAAAIGCGALLLHLRSDSSTDRLGGRAAADALQYVPTPAVQPVAPAPVANVAPAIAAPSEPSAPQPSAAAEHTSTRAPATAAGASRAEPGSPQQLLEDGRNLVRQGRFGLAEGMFLKALAAQPDSSAATAEIVRVHLARRDGAEAVRWANRLVGMQANPGLAQLLLGDAEALHGDASAAHEAWTRAAHAGNATARERLDEE